MNSERIVSRSPPMRNTPETSVHDAPVHPSTPPEDEEEFLDWAFDHAVAQLEEGRDIAVDDLLHGRESLRPQLEEIIRTARQVAIGAPQAFSAPPPRVIAGYTILNEIGRGGMGAVYLARQEALGGRFVALKVLPWNFAAAGRSLERFRNEARAIARLRHPNIVAVHDIVHQEQTHAFAMEWVDGASLADLIDEIRLSEEGQAPSSAGWTWHDDSRLRIAAASLNPPPEAFAGLTWPAYVIRVGLAIARALAEVHRAGLLHRDVKPSNILIRREGTPMLSDFGLVRETNATITQAGSFAGTAAYASPEQLRGDYANLDQRADIYSLGATLYQALVLRLPFTGRTTNDLLVQIESGLATPVRKLNARLPVDLQTIVSKAMEADPARRYQSADDSPMISNDF